MNLRNIILLAGLAVFMSACAFPPGSSSYRDNGQPYDDDYYDYRNTPSYEGYYYVRIIFIRDVPYYVDDDRYIRPIPPRLYDHFRRYPYNTLGRPPVFSRDTEVRDGYPVSHIIYLDGVPYHVGNDRIAQPLPEPLQPRFRYTPPNQGNPPAHGNRPQPPAQPPAQHDNDRNIEPPVQIRDQDRVRVQPPPFIRGQPEGGRDSSADTNGRTTPSPEPRSLFLRQAQPNAGGSQADTTNGKDRYLNGNRPQATDDSAKKKTDKKEADKKKSRTGKKDKKGDSTKSDDGSGKKPRSGKDDDQGGNDRGNGNRRD
jgi:hypothetical protein